ncbi:unnamed protein product [Ilex paraguariensis]|uniref:Uncharacterized protein n=1 Tax=Ilex paraguariensis TaxID=185542 RepID=A0ABC8R2Z6_9AQUA
MEWPEFCESPSDQSFFNIVPPEIDVDLTEWTFEENKLFENALAEFDPSSAVFFENVASKVPWKSMDEIKKHYQDLVEDIEMIESGLVPLPSYNTVDQESKSTNMIKSKNEKGSSSQTKKLTSHQQRRRGVPWTEEEHQRFLMGLNKYGKGDWRSISRYYVVSKTPTQVASHAQKYFRRQNSSTPLDRRRPSIHDIQTVNPSFISSTQKQNYQPNNEDPVPISNLYGNNIAPTNNNGELSDFASGGGGTSFPPAATTFAMGNNMNSQVSDAYTSSYLLGSSLRNKYWG